MKMKTFSSAVIWGLIAVSFNAQPKDIPESEYIGIFTLINDNGTLAKLERATFEQKVKTRGFGFAGGKSYIQTKGERSPVRFNASQDLQFAVRLESQARDPRNEIQFFQLEPYKGLRRIQTAKVGFMGSGSRNTSNDSTVSYDVTKYGNSSFRIRPSTYLSPGEYCFGINSTPDGFCFGIDSS